MAPELTWKAYFEVFFGQVWKNSGKIPSNPQKLACSYAYGVNWWKKLKQDLEKVRELYFEIHATPTHNAAITKAKTQLTPNRAADFQQPLNESAKYCSGNATCAVINWFPGKNTLWADSAASPCGVLLL